jgi:hypothetical protein
VLSTNSTRWVRGSAPSKALELRDNWSPSTQMVVVGWSDALLTG